MAKTKIQKQESLKKISEILKGAKSVVFAGFDKLTVGENTQARKTMRTSGVKLLTVKKTLLAKALAESQYGAGPDLKGQVALAYAQEDSDALAPAREVFQAGRKYDGKFSILGGIFDGAYADSERMLSIAMIPSREVLLAQFVNLINSPIQRFAVVLDAIAKTKSA